MLNFDFLEKGLGLVSPPLFVYHFFGKSISHVMFYYCKATLLKSHFGMGFLL